MQSDSVSELHLISLKTVGSLHWFPSKKITHFEMKAINKQMHIWTHPHIYTQDGCKGRMDLCMVVYMALWSPLLSIPLSPF